MKNPESTQPIWTVSHPLSFMRVGAATEMLIRSARLITIARNDRRATSIRFGHGRCRTKRPADDLLVVNVQNVHIEEPSIRQIAIGQNASLENQTCPQAHCS